MENSDSNAVGSNKQPPTGAQPNGVQPTQLVKTLYGVPNERGGTSWLEDCPDYIETSLKNPDHALVVRYKEARSNLAVKRALNLCSIHIQSPYLKNILKKVFKHYPGVDVDEEEPSFEPPFYPLFHQWASLVAEHDNAKEEGNGQQNQIAALLDILRKEIGDDMRDAQNLTKNGNITFRNLWTLYPPGCPVLAQWKDQQHLFLVQEASYAKAEVEPLLVIEMIFLDRDGERYGWRKVNKWIQAYGGTARIDGLDVIPVHLHQNALETISKLSQRGSLVTGLLTHPPEYKSYEGPIRLHRNFDIEEVQIFVEGRIMIDPKGHSEQVPRYAPSISTIPYRLESLLSRDSDTKLANAVEFEDQISIMNNLNRHPILSSGQSKLSSIDPTNIADKSPLRRHRWTEALFGIRPEAFCRSVVRGYCLTSKSWAEFEVDKISEIQWNKQAFDALVMPPPRKRLLEALVKQQQTHKKDADMDDVVKGKGQGLIMLLTGPPGVGKTLTAESIADRLQLPLYAVSASELGDSAKAIEERFGEILRLAASWNAVLLLDEADAFLDRRVDSPESQLRNKRVAGKTWPLVREAITLTSQQQHSSAFLSTTRAY
jgi:hypothetical protein